MAEALEIQHDGDCPFCSAHVRMLNLRQTVGRVEMIDARSGDPRVKALVRAKVDLDAGLAVRHGARLYHGAEAVQLLSVLSEGRGVMQAVLYPVLRTGRGLVLRLLNRRGLR